ncbi:MAG: xanthine dehydrogenase family protein molybdopterin-binding subunit [Candidatus Rokubacteria bacterium]|nr:xanthine dehydrogenase family protein molybdopterin-binding subunit [Candidatus Rokubacteria bacterium]
MAEPTGFIGRSMKRREDRPLIVGAGRYVDDIRAPGLCHLVFVRSPHAHARLVSANVDAARRAPGVVAVVTGADVASLGGTPVTRLFPDMVVPRVPLLVTDVARAQGAPVVAVVADSVYAAADAAALVDLTWEPLPGAAEPETAIAEGAPRIHADAPGNRCLGARMRGGSDVPAAAQTVRVRVEQARLAGVPLEPRGTLATWDAIAGDLTVWISTQNPFRIRSEVARIIGLDETHVRVIAPDVGGGFGVKGGPYRDEIITAWLAWTLRRPVKWISTRAEDLLTTHHGRGGHCDAELSVTADGKLTKLSARILCPVGGDPAFSAAVNPRNHARCLPGPYVLDAVDIEFAGIFTTTPPVGAYRGAGRPEGTFVLERLVDEAARAIGADPIEIRRRNAIPAATFPFTTLTGQSYDSGDYALLLDALVKATGYDALRARVRERRARGEVVGVGVSLYVEPAALGWESGAVRVEKSGSVTCITGASPHGQGHETTFAQIVADYLGIEPERITIRHGDTAGAPQAIGTSGSRSTALAGSALAIAATQVREKGKRIAAAILEAAPEDIAPAVGGYHVKGSRDRFAPWPAVAELAYRWGVLPPGVEPGLEATHFFKPDGEVWSAGAVLAVVRVERETGEVIPERLAWVDDAGTIVNPLLADAQLEGSLAQAWGGIMCEAVAFDRDGHVLSGTLMDYALPRADSVPHAEIHHTHTPSPRNVLGVKGLGEAGNIGVPPAVVNALVDALAPFGVRHVDMPLTSEKVWRALADPPSRA